MTELWMVRRMIRRGLVAGPVAVVGVGLWGGLDSALAGALGIGMALLNLWLAARIIGGVADRHPQLLAAAGMATFALGLILLSVIAFFLRSTELVSFPITGITLVVSHLALVLWEAATGKQAMEPKLTTRQGQGQSDVRLGDRAGERSS